MTDRNPKSWKTITREERYFTSLLFQDLRECPGPFMNLLHKQIKMPAGTKVKEVGFEVCFFRDAFHSGHIERHKDLEKQTFDLVLFLDSNQMVIVEAKAQQGFKTK